MVAKGFKQDEGIDYFDSYALIARITFIHLALASVYNLYIKWMLNNNGDLDEEVYIEQPESFVLPHENKVCKLIKTFYGLNQAPK